MSPGIAIAAISFAFVVVTALRRDRRAFPNAPNAPNAPVGRRLDLDDVVLNRYLDEGGPSGQLGRPVTGRRPTSPAPHTPLGADQEVVFEHGTIYLDSTVGHTKVLLIE